MAPGRLLLPIDRERANLAKGGDITKKEEMVARVFGQPLQNQFIRN